MSLEQKIEALTAAIEANTAALLKSGGKPAAAAKTDSDDAEKPAAAAKKTTKPAKVESEHTREEMQAALGELKEATDAATAKAVISKHGGVAKRPKSPTTRSTPCTKLPRRRWKRPVLKTKTTCNSSP